MSHWDRLPEELKWMIYREVHRIGLRKVHEELGRFHMWYGRFPGWFAKVQPGLRLATMSLFYSRKCLEKFVVEACGVNLLPFEER